MESAFTDAEKRFVLAEMIKVSHMDVSTLVDFVKHHDIAPDWLEMQLPGGRNIRQCLRAAELMFNMSLQPPTVPSLKRKSFGDISDHLPKRHAMMSPVEPQPYQTPRNPGHYGSITHAQHHPQPQQQPPSQHQPPAHHLPQPHGPPQPVNIQPRPVPNGFATSPSISSPTVSANTYTASGRKRGRPSKADKEAWARANTSQPTHYAPITPAPIAPLPVTTQPQPNYSPSPVAPPAYQVSSTAPASEPKSKAKGRMSAAAADTQRRSESVPRSIQPMASSDPHDHRDASDQQMKSEKEEQEWRDRAGQARDRTPGAPPGPIPLEPPIHPHSAIGQSRHQSGSPFAASTHRESMGPAMEHARSEGHPPVANPA